MQSIGKRKKQGTAEDWLKSSDMLKIALFFTSHHMCSLDSKWWDNRKIDQFGQDLDSEI